MRKSIERLALATALIAGLACPAFAQDAQPAPGAQAPQATAPGAPPRNTASDPETEPLNLAVVLGDPGAGWRKQAASVESVTFVCDTDNCGGRGVIGVSQAQASGDYLKQIVADPDKMMPSYKYGSEESMKAAGCKFDKYDVKRLTDRRIEILSQGLCPESTHAAMTTIFDADKTLMASVQVLAKSEEQAIKLREASAEKLTKALAAPATPR